jgi:hypothetical protein
MGFSVLVESFNLLAEKRRRTKGTLCPRICRRRREARRDEDDRTGCAASANRRIVEQAIFASRWVLAPIYIGLAAGLLVLRGHRQSRVPRPLPHQKTQRTRFLVRAIVRPAWTRPPWCVAIDPSSKDGPLILACARCGQKFAAESFRYLQDLNRLSIR